MSLSTHVDPDLLIKSGRDHSDGRHHNFSRSKSGFHNSGYGSRYETNELPKFQLPKGGCTADAAYQLIHDETDLDGRPNLNLASFVHTWMPPEADKLMLENVSKNLIDEDEYPATVSIHHRCVSMISNLWKIQKGEKAIGTATTGSSEGILLGGLALKRNWQTRMKAAGKSIHEPGPNIIMGANAQVCLEKFARYFDVEARLVPVTEKSRYCLDVKEAIKLCDENTIGVFVILGSTYTGHYENVKDMSDALDEYEKSTGINIPIHVDAASGGFVAPFVHPHLKWSFELPRVLSIQSSGHKFGLAYVGVGWVIWRDQKHLPKDLIFELHYLGSTELSFSLNFSRPAAPIIAQFFSFIHLGLDGYKAVAEGDFKNARLLSRALENSGYFKVLSEIHKPLTTHGSYDETLAASYQPGLPVVAFRFTDAFQKKNPDVQQKFIQTLLRAKGWIVPNYSLPPTLEKVEILRVVVRESMSEDLVDRLLVDLLDIVESLEKSSTPERALAILGAKNTQHHASHEHKETKPTHRGSRLGTASVTC